MRYDNEHTSSFLRGLNLLTGLPYKKLQQYVKENNLFNILEHPQILQPDSKQLKKICLLNEFIASYNLLKVYEANQRVKIDSSTKAGRYFLALMGGMKDRERFIVAFLDSGNNVIETKTISEGTIGQAVVYPRDILKAAITNDCKNMILAHNHPGNSLEPSFEDKMITQKVVDIFHPLDIKVIDHIIVADSSYSSMAERGYIPCNTKATASYEPITLDQDLRLNAIKEINGEEEWER